MVTSVEEESSFPLPTQNPVQGSFGGRSHAVEFVGERQNPNRNQPWLPHGFCYPQQPATHYRQHHFRDGQTHRPS